MAQAPPPPPPSPPLVLGLPTWVMEDFCQKMDCLNDYDWMRFGEQHGRVGEAAARCLWAVGQPLRGTCEWRPTWEKHIVVVNVAAISSLPLRSAIQGSVRLIETELLCFLWALLPCSALRNLNVYGTELDWGLWTACQAGP